MKNKLQDNASKRNHMFYLRNNSQSDTRIQMGYLDFSFVKEN